MARKLKSDRVLFTAALLLVCASIVMVYSASAVVALERFQQPYFFVTRQALWAVLGLAVLAPLYFFKCPLYSLLYFLKCPLYSSLFL